MVGGMPADVLDAPGRLIVTPHPVLLDGQRNVAATFYPGESLAEFLARLVPDIESGSWTVSIGGFVVPQAMWRCTYPKHGQTISCRGSVHKSALGFVAMAALAYFTFGAGWTLGATALGINGLAAVGAAGAFALNAGIFIAGAVLINKVLVPKIPRLGQSSADTAREIYSLSGQRNSPRPYEPIGVLLGEMRVTPDVASQPYTRFASDDQYLNLMLLGGINVDSYEDLSVGDTPLSSYSDVHVFTNGFSGMASVDVPLFANADSIDGAVLEDTTAWVTRTSSVDAIQLEVDLQYQLFKQGDNGLENYTLTVQAEYRAVGSGSWLSFNSATFTNKTMETRRVTWSLGVVSGQYEVRLRRTDGVNPDRVTRTVQWSTLRTIQPDNTDYSGWGRIGINIKATGQLNGSLDTVRATYKPRPLPVWDGSAWANATTRPGVSNPGALILQVLRGIYHGDVLQFGYGLTDDQIDVEGLKGFMLHCTANGFAYDRWITEQISLGALLEEIALAGMGQFMWLDGSRPTVMWAADGQPLGGVVNMANMARGSFSVGYQLSNAADGIEYQYVDRDRNFETTTLRVMAPGVTTMLNPARITGQGVTTEAHAAKMARYHLAQSLYQYKDISFGADIESLDYRRMSVLSLSHDMTQWGYGGRLVGAAVVGAAVVGGDVVITLDEPVPSLPSRFVGLRVPGEQDYRVFGVAAFTGPSNVLTLIGTWPAGVAFPGDSADNPAHDTLWCYDVKSTPGYRVRVVSIEPDSDLKGATVRVVPESDEFWTYVETGTYVPAPSQSLIPELDAPAVLNIRVQAQTNVQGNTEWVQLNVVWDSTGDLDHCQVWAAIDGQPLRLVDGQAVGNRSSFRIDENGNWLIQVRPFDRRGVAGTSASVLYLTSVIDQPPPNVDVFAVDEVDGGLRRYRFGYSGTSPSIYAGVQIRYRSGSTPIVLSDWDSLTPLGTATDIYTQAAESTLPAAGTWTFACRAISTSGVLAASVAQVTVTLAGTFTDIFTPDPTPAPTPTGASVTAGFARLFIETDTPTYTQGHGHGKTRVYGVLYTGGAEPVFSSASLLTEFTGPVGNYATELGKTWRIWLTWVTTDGGESTTPAGGSGTNGIAATTGLVGTSDLGNAIVLAQNLAPSSVTADKAALDIGGDNLVGNNSFEVDADGDGMADGWAIYNNDGGAVPTTAGRWPGRISGFSQRIAWTGTNTATKGLIGSSPGAAVRGGWRPGGSYVVSFYARADSDKPYGMSLQWNVSPATTTALKNPAVTTSWQRYAFRILWGASVEASGQFYISIEAGSPVTGWLEFDDIQIESGDTLTAYAGKLAANTIVAGDGAIGNAAITNLLVADAAIDNAKIVNVSVAKLIAGALAVSQYIRSTNYVAGASGWNISADGSAEFGAASIRGQLVASQIDSRGLSIKDASGNVILAAGSPLAAANVTPASGWLNSNVSLNSDGTLSGAGGGQVVSLPVPDTRAVNTPPSGYGKVHIKEFKQQNAIGVGSSGYCVLETLKGWQDGSGGQAMQWAYVDSGTVYKRSAAGDAGAWGAWVRDLDRATYTGDLDATYGAPTGSTVAGDLAQNVVRPGNPITSGNVSTYIADVAIGAAQVGVLTAGNLTVGALSGTVNAGAASTDARVEITTNRIDVYDASNHRRVRIGLL